MKKNKAFGKVIFLIILFFLSFPLGAKGQKEGDLFAQVNQLMEARLYNEAISLLTQVARKEPEKFDEINLLLKKIRIAQQEYNEKYNELLNTYESDLEQAYVLIKELEEMNPAPNERTRASLIRARETAGFVFNKNRWEGIMEDALVLLNEENYWQAVDMYRSGFDLSRDIFDDANYDQVLVDAVDEELALLNEQLDQFRDLKDDLEQNRLNEEQAYSNGDFEEYSGIFIPLLENYRELALLLLSLTETAGLYISLEESIRLSRGDDKQIFHLIYLELLLTGRPDSQVREGIIGALDKLWTEGVAEFTSHTDSLTRAVLQKALDEYASGNFDDSAENFLLVQGFAGLDQTAVGLWLDRIATDPGVEPSLEQKVVYDLWQNRDGSARIRNQISIQYRELIDSIARADRLTVREKTLTLISEGTPIRMEFQAERDNILAAIARWREILDGYLAREDEPGILSRDAELAEQVLAELAIREADLISRETDLIVHMGSIEQEILSRRLTELKADYEEALSFLKGIPISLGAGDKAQEITAFYPDRAQRGFQALNSLLEPLRQDILSARATLQDEKSPFDEAPAVQNLISLKTVMLQELQTLITGANQNLQTANQQIFTAQRFRQEGDQRLAESRQLMRQGEYPGAKERLASAVTRYDESLALQEDPALRVIRDQNIPALFQEIQQEENRLVITQVRQYLTQGQTLYSQTDFAGANSLFLRAQNRWADTNAETNPEVEYWLELTRTALSVTTGREISTTDPLFIEMRQYLNQATLDYNQAVAYKKSGREEDAEMAFNRAERNLLYVQQFFPFYKDARVLTIKISQQRDPEGFRELFQKDFNDARNLIRTNPQQAYAELKDLEAIDPRYPGLAAAITEAEYATGIKVRPPDPQKVARSRELFQRANGIYNNNARTQFQVALAYLNEALTLVPNYQEALRLKDTISVAIGGTSTEVLSSADQQKYQEAITEFTAGNYLRAQIIVDILLNNPDNRNNTRLLELKARIESAR